MTRFAMFWNHFVGAKNIIFLSVKLFFGIFLHIQLKKLVQIMCFCSTSTNALLCCLLCVDTAPLDFVPF